MPAKTSLLAASLLLLLIACEKEKSFSADTSPSASGSKLTTVIWRWHDSAAYEFFFYDDQDRLTHLVDSENTNHSKRFTSFVYNAEGRLLKRIATNDYNSMVVQDSFWYDNDYIIRRATTSSWYLGYSNTYTYDSQGRLISDSARSPGSDHVLQYTDYTYDSNDDIVGWQEFHDESGMMKSDGVVVASNNNSINPFFDLRALVYTDWYGNSALSKHLRTQLTYYDGTVEKYDYEYYPDGRVKKVTTTDSSDGFSDNTTEEFFYE